MCGVGANLYFLLNFVMNLKLLKKKKSIKNKTQTHALALTILHIVPN